MSQVGDQRAYWDGAGATKAFTHPVDVGWLEDAWAGARVLDYGCGYGRVTAELDALGCAEVVGVDLSASLIERARQLHPDLRFEVLTSPPGLPRGLGSFDIVLLIAVLTCVVDAQAQEALVAEVTRALRPGAHLYVSDVLLQGDDRNLHRYDAGAPGKDVPYGTFVTDDGVLCRHHDRAHLRALFSHLDLVSERPIRVDTMNGNQVDAIQMLLRQP